jgi:hypothetical protein
MTRFWAGLAFAAALAISGTAHALDILWYTGGVTSPVVGGYKTNISLLSTPGAGDPSAATWNITYWDSGAAPVGSFNALVVASPQGGWSTNPNYTALDAAGLTFGDRVLVTGQDADWHYLNSPGPTNFDGPRGFLRDSINWAGNGTGLGLVVLGGPSDVLSTYGFTSTLGASSGSTDDVRIPAAFAGFPINTNLTSAGLSNWGTSAHDIWSSPDLTKWTGINTAGAGPGFVTLVSAATASGGIGGTPGIPEPASWAMMLVGFFGLGSMLRRRRGLAATA